MRLTFGSDPEMFFTDEGGKVLPAGVVFDKLGIEHETPIMAGNLYVDGAALEVQPDPSEDPAEVVYNLRRLLEAGLEVANAYGTTIQIVPELPIDLKWCEKDERLAIFGCDPDQSAWGEGCKPGTIDAASHPWRYAGCHIHVGVVGDPAFFQTHNRIQVVSKFLDRTVGLAAMVISSGSDERRREIYGRPGIYRYQEHGMEYRTPSNPILLTPEVMEFIFKLAGEVVLLTDQGQLDPMQEIIPDGLILEVLRSGDLSSAAKLYQLVSEVYGFEPIPVVHTQDWVENWF